MISMGNRYGEEIKSIEISHARTCTPHEQLTESELSIWRTELGKLTRTARTDRPDLIYDLAAAAQAFPKGEIIVGNKKRNFGRRNRNSEKEEGKTILGIWPDL